MSKELELIADAIEDHDGSPITSDDLAAHVVSRLSDAGYSIVQVPEPDLRDSGIADWDAGTAWTKPGSGKVRVYLEDSRLTAQDARELAGQLLAAAAAAAEEDQ